MNTLEQAIALGKNRKDLAKRLLEARSCLLTKYRQLFKRYTFDFENQRFISENEMFVLQWRVRYNPDAPISYDNQQTNRGTCVLLDYRSNEEHKIF